MSATINIDTELEKELSEKLVVKHETQGGTKLVHFQSAAKGNTVGTAKLTSDGVWKYFTTGGICGEIKGGAAEKKTEKKVEKKPEAEKAPEVKAEEKTEEKAPAHSMEGSLESSADQDNNVCIRTKDGREVSVPTTKPISQMNGGMVSMLIARVRKANEGCVVLNTNIPEKYRG